MSETRTVLRRDGEEHAAEHYVLTKEWAGYPAGTLITTEWRGLAPPVDGKPDATAPVWVDTIRFAQMQDEELLGSPEVPETAREAPGSDDPGPTRTEPQVKGSPFVLDSSLARAGARKGAV